MRRDRPQRNSGGHAQDIAKERKQSPPQKQTRPPPRRSEGWNERLRQGLQLRNKREKGDRPLKGVVVACLLHTQEVPGSIPGRGSYLRQVSLH